MTHRHGFTLLIEACNREPRTCLTTVRAGSSIRKQHTGKAWPDPCAGPAHGHTSNVTNREICGRLDFPDTCGANSSRQRCPPGTIIRSIRSGSMRRCHSGHPRPGVESSSIRQPAVTSTEGRPTNRQTRSDRHAVDGRTAVQPATRMRNSSQERSRGQHDSVLVRIQPIARAHPCALDEQRAVAVASAQRPASRCAWGRVPARARGIPQAASSVASRTQPSTKMPAQPLVAALVVASQ